MKKITNVWLRVESRLGERRTTLIPEHAKALIQAGYPVTVEKSPDRIFPDEDYAACGCVLVEPETWPNAPDDALIVGLKELADADFPLKHRHLYAVHGFDGEIGSGKTLKRFDAGGGTCYADEVLLNSVGRQIMAQGAGFIAGAVGIALGLDIWDKKQNGLRPPFAPRLSFDSLKILIDYLSGLNLAKLREAPRCLVVAPYGNVGRGARFVLDSLKIPSETWARKETSEAAARTAEFLGEYEIVCNCISMDNIAQETVTPVLTTLEAMRAFPEKRLSVIADISCYPTHPKNTLPIYSRVTTLADPTIRVEGVDVIAIDHLPTMMPRVCSEMISGDLFASILQLLTVGDAVPNTPWPYALERFHSAPREF